MHNSNHVYTVELRFWDRDLDANALSNYLGLAPSILIGFEEPDLRIGGKRCWGYNGHDKVGFETEWSSLEQGVTFLLDALSPVKRKVTDLSSKFDGILWCGHFQSSFDGGPLLSSALMGHLASFKLPLFIDCYFSQTER